MKKIFAFSILLTLFSLSSLISKLWMQPYLQAVTDSSIIVMVESDTRNEILIKFGEDETLKNSKATSYYIPTDSRKQTYVHRIILSRLKANTKYFYKAVQEESSSSIYSFRTAVKPGTGFRFLAVGDFRSNPEIHNTIAKEAAKHKPAFSIYVGDLCYNSLFNTWKKEFFVKEQLNLSSTAPFFNAVGNHEGWAQNTKAYQQSPSLNEKNSPYYKFEYGDVLFVVINTQQNIKKGSEQYKFIEAALKTSEKKWKIVAAHNPAYCSGGHGEESYMVNLTTELLEPNKVDFVLAGHSHFYQHNLIKGIRHMVVGGGGAPLYDPVQGKYTIKSEKAYSYAIFDADKDKIKMTVYDILGKIIDTLEVKK